MKNIKLILPILCAVMITGCLTYEPVSYSESDIEYHFGNRLWNSNYVDAYGGYNFTYAPNGLSLQIIDPQKNVIMFSGAYFFYKYNNNTLILLDEYNQVVFQLEQLDLRGNTYLTEFFTLIRSQSNVFRMKFY